MKLTPEGEPKRQPQIQRFSKSNLSPFLCYFSSVCQSPQILKINSRSEAYYPAAVVILSVILNGHWLAGSWYSFFSMRV